MGVRNAEAVTDFVNSLADEFKQDGLLVNNTGFVLGAGSEDKAALADWHTMSVTNAADLLTVTHSLLLFKREKLS